MDLQKMLLSANALVCMLIVLRLMFYQKKSGHYRFLYSLLAWLVIVAAGWIAIRIFYGEYSAADPAELLLNFSFCLTVWGAGGNIAKATNWQNKRGKHGK